MCGKDDDNWVERLRFALAVGNSVWTTAPDKRSLTRRVDSIAEAAVARAVAPHDAASQELAEAWRNAYSREPNPSDAWAVEHILKPVVCPRNLKATLGPS